jgi:hypothetical protein
MHAVRVFLWAIMGCLVGIGIGVPMTVPGGPNLFRDFGQMQNAVPLFIALTTSVIFAIAGATDALIQENRRRR